jgi:hypothetical protein
VKLAFYFTLACTARCDHCITHAGPKVRRKMTLDDARAVVAGVARVPHLDGIVFTGGENFIHRDELLQLVQDCTALNLKSEVITNAFWATNPAAAREMIAPFRDAGLGLIRVSIDRFHLPYVTPARVHTALDALADLGFGRHVTSVVEQHNAIYKKSTLRDLVDADPDALAGWDEGYAAWMTSELQRGWPPDLIELLTLYGFDLPSCFLIDDAYALREHESWTGARPFAEYLAGARNLIQYQFLATEGRGRMLLGSVGDKHVDDIHDSVCNSVIFSPTVTPEGDVFPCCSSWVNHKHQAMGNVHDASLGDLLTRVNHDPVALFMHYQGPGALVKYLRAKPLPPTPIDDPLQRRMLTVVQPPPLPDRYTHTCHLCGVLLETYSRAQLEAAIRAYYDDNPWRMILPTRGFDPVVTADVAPL